MQDQFFASKGGANVVILGGQTEEGEDLSGSSTLDISEFVERLYLVYTNETRSSLDIAVRQNEKTEALDETMLESLNKVKEIGTRIEGYLHSRSYREIANLFTQHWEAKIRRDHEIATPEMFQIWNNCLGAGALGGKLIGLGGGGYFLMYSEVALTDIGGIPLRVAPNGAEIVHTSERQVIETYAD